MGRRKLKKPHASSHPWARKRLLISARLSSIARRPVAITLALGLAASVLGYSILRAFEKRSSMIENERQSLSAKEASDSFQMSPAPVFKADVVAEFHHDPQAFTQGLLFHDGYFYESTGLNGKSSVRKIEVTSGRVIHSNKLRSEDFGEGLALTGGDKSALIQVLWKVGKGYVYDRSSLQVLSSFTHEGDAWGLASSGPALSEFFLSDGSSRIRVLQFQETHLRQIREFTVRDGSREVGLLNELEVVGTELWANVWMADFIARIDIQTGNVLGWIDLRGILRKDAIPIGHEVDVLNGIAYDPQDGAVYVTGKRWPKVFRIQLSEQQVATNISHLTNAFFLNPEQVEYVHKYVIA